MSIAARQPDTEVPCPKCAQTLWIVGGSVQAVLFPAPSPADAAAPARVVVCFAGRILGGEETPRALFDKLSALVEVPARRDLILDFRHVEFVASAALGKFIALNRKLLQQRNRLRVSNLNGELREVLRRTRLDQLLIIESGDDLQPAAR